MAMLWTQNFVLPDDFGLTQVKYFFRVPEGAYGAAVVLVQAARMHFMESVAEPEGKETWDGEKFRDRLSWESGECQWSMSATTGLPDSPYLAYSAVCEVGYGEAEIEAAFDELAVELRPRVRPSVEEVRAVQRALGERGAACYRIYDVWYKPIFAGDLWIDRALPPADREAPYPVAPPRRAPAVMWSRAAGETVPRDASARA